ncbi:CLUMA_CG010148, isoform A [Clunio marinus]|uniref:CLUMA_CG010148, isoform A n=1 Tax=Clunio marinus TaxID=568069 RepID=A0A1J1IDV9_9DIPT|nr:CLUMA_CG010148, isoform A [Clunio marinus]
MKSTCKQAKTNFCFVQLLKLSFRLLVYQSRFEACACVEWISHFKHLLNALRCCTTHRQFIDIAS